MSDLPATRQSLLLKLAQRDDQAWEEFLEIYEKAILGYCIRRGLRESDAQDAAQDVYTAIQKRLPSWDHEASGSFRAWLFRVARNIALNQVAELRRKAAIGGTQFDAAIAQIQDSSGGVDDSNLFQLQWQRAIFEWACRQVSQQVKPVTWEAFRLTATQGEPVETVADKLGISTGSVYTAKCRVMSRIRRQVDRWNSDDFPIDSIESSMENS